MARVKEQYTDQVRVVYRHFPLISIHDKAALSTQASEAAGAQGKFWEMHDLLFERQGEWAALSVEEFQAWVNERATELGLDKEQFTSDMLSEENEALAQSAWDRGVEVGLPGTP
ncbi:MAG: DsbA family protein, partial [bacterium]